MSHRVHAAMEGAQPAAHDPQVHGAPRQSDRGQLTACDDAMLALGQRDELDIR